MAAKDSGTANRSEGQDGNRAPMFTGPKMATQDNFSKTITQKRLF